MRLLILILCTVLITFSYVVHTVSSQEDDAYYIQIVENLLKERSMGFSNTFSDKENSELGDKVSVALLRIFSEEQLRKPENITLFLPIIRNAFLSLSAIEGVDAKKPKVTLLLLQCLRHEVKETALKKEIEQTIGFIEENTTISQHPMQDPLKRRVFFYEKVRVNAHFILRDLATTYKIQIGFEPIPEDFITRSDGIISIKIDEGTISDVLNAVAQSDPRYQWEEVDGVINVFPKEHRKSLLDTKVSSFYIDHSIKRDVADVIADLPEVRVALNRMGIDWRNESTLSNESCDQSIGFSLKLHNVTVRTILNEIIKRDKCCYWYVNRHGENFKYVTINIE